MWRSYHPSHNWDQDLFLLSDNALPERGLTVGPRQAQPIPLLSDVAPCPQASSTSFSQRYTDKSGQSDSCFSKILSSGTNTNSLADLQELHTLNGNTIEDFFISPNFCPQGLNDDAGRHPDMDSIGDQFCNNSSTPSGRLSSIMDVNLGPEHLDMEFATQNRHPPSMENLPKNATTGLLELSPSKKNGTREQCPRCRKTYHCREDLSKHFISHLEKPHFSWPTSPGWLKVLVEDIRISQDDDKRRLTCETSNEVRYCDQDLRQHFKEHKHPAKRDRFLCHFLHCRRNSSSTRGQRRHDLKSHYIRQHMKDKPSQQGKKDFVHECIEKSVKVGELNAERQ